MHLDEPRSPRTGFTDRRNRVIAKQQICLHRALQYPPARQTSKPAKQGGQVSGRPESGPKLGPLGEEYRAGCRSTYWISLALRAASPASWHASGSVSDTPRVTIVRLPIITSQYQRPSCPPLGMIRNSTPGSVLLTATLLISCSGMQVNAQIAEWFRNDLGTMYLTSN